jgi:hypothetical protein
VDVVVLVPVLLDGDVGQVDVHVVHLAGRVVVLHGAEPTEAVLVKVALKIYFSVYKQKHQKASF